MKDFIPKPSGIKVGGLSRAAQKLQSAREKAAQTNTGGKALAGTAAPAPKAKDTFAPTKKVSFQRKAV